MDNRSLAQEITSALVEAKELHHLAVQLGTEVDENWPVFYGKYLAIKLRPLLTTVQGVSFSVDGQALPPFYTRRTQEEIGASFTSRLHVGE